jgi:hypothetical protein
MPQRQSSPLLPPSSNLSQRRILSEIRLPLQGNEALYGLYAACLPDHSLSQADHLDTICGQLDRATSLPRVY